MTKSSKPIVVGRPSGQAEATAAIIERFRRELSTDATPALESALHDAGDGERPTLLAGLIQLEVAFRLDHGEAVGRDEYLTRFPGEDEAIAAAFAAVAAERGDLVPRFRLRRGVRVHNLRLGGEIGRGGMAVVHRAFDEELNRPLALKTLLIEPSAQELARQHDHKLTNHESHDRLAEAGRRMRFEAEITARLSHPGVPPVHSLGQLPDGRPYFCMRLIEGQTFSELLKRNPGDVGSHLQIFEQVAQILASAHQAQVIHRDLKPSNIMVGRYGEVQIMDWGMAKVVVSRSGDHAASDGRATLAPEPRFPSPVVDGPDDETVTFIDTAFDSANLADGDETQHGTILGTLAYMPPEQAQGRTGDHAPPTDVFALGAILCQILTGRPPYRGSHREELFRQAFHGELRPALELLEQADVDPQLQALTRQCLEVDGRQRPPNAAAVADAVRHYLTTVQQRLKQADIERVQALTQAAEQSKRADLERAKRRISLALAGVVTTLLIGMIASVAVVRWLQLHNEAVVAQEREQNDRARTTSLLEALRTAPAAGVPYAVESLSPLQQYAVPELQAVVNRNTAKGDVLPHEDFRAAVALATFGHVHTERLLANVPDLDDAECTNLVIALEQDRERALDLVHKIVGESPAADAAQRDLHARLAIVALHLGDPSLFAARARYASDPRDRTHLIMMLATWHGDLTTLARQAERIDDAAVRSAICQGLSCLDRDEVSQSLIQAWQPRLNDWYLSSTDAGTHSSAKRTLTAWGLEPPPTSLTRNAPPGQRWHVNGQGLTMIAIDAGTSPADSGQLWVCDQEISVGLYRRFLTDPDYPADQKPRSTADDSDFYADLDPDTPAGQVSWWDALRFCNWLSSVEGVQPCYALDDKSWDWDEGADGYRLLTEAEWQYAAGAGTTTLYSHGNAVDLLDEYAVYFAVAPARCGSKLPNAFGLFDMHGNVREWCIDPWSPELMVYDRNDPLNQPERNRVLRGGSYSQGPLALRTAARSFGPQNSRAETIGFRIARTSTTRHQSRSW